MAKKGKQLDIEDTLPGVPIEGFVEETVYNIKPRFDADGVQSTSGIGLDGCEYPDPHPISPPVGYDRPPDVYEMIRNMVRSERVQAELEAQGLETFEEADDFEIEDDPADPLTEYERVFEPPPTPAPTGTGEAGKQPTPETPSNHMEPAAAGPSQTKATSAASDPKVGT